MNEKETLKIKKPNIFTFFSMVFFNLLSSFLLFSSTLIASLSMIFLYGRNGVAVTAVKAILAGVSIFLKVFPVQKLLREIRRFEAEEGDHEKKPVPLSLVAIIGVDVSGMIYIYYILDSQEFFLTILGGWILLTIYLALISYRVLVSYYHMSQEDNFESKKDDDDPYKYGRR